MKSSPHLQQQWVSQFLTSPRGRCRRALLGWCGSSLLPLEGGVTKVCQAQWQISLLPHSLSGTPGLLHPGAAGPCLCGSLLWRELCPAVQGLERMCRRGMREQLLLWSGMPARHHWPAAWRCEHHEVLGCDALYRAGHQDQLFHMGAASSGNSFCCGGRRSTGSRPPA